MFSPFIFFDVSNSLRRRRKNWVGSAAKAFGPLLQLYQNVESDSNCVQAEAMTRESRDWVSMEPQSDSFFSQVCLVWYGFVLQQRSSGYFFWPEAREALVYATNLNC